MLVPVTKTFWRRKVGTRDFVACNVTVHITSVPVTSIYCITIFPVSWGVRVSADRSKQKSFLHLSSGRFSGTGRKMNHLCNSFPDARPPPVALRNIRLLVEQKKPHQAVRLSFLSEIRVTDAAWEVMPYILTPSQSPSSHFFLVTSAMAT